MSSSYDELLPVQRWLWVNSHPQLIFPTPPRLLLEKTFQEEGDDEEGPPQVDRPDSRGLAGGILGRINHLQQQQQQGAEEEQRRSSIGRGATKVGITSNQEVVVGGSRVATNSRGGRSGAPGGKGDQEEEEQDSPPLSPAVQVVVSLLFVLELLLRCVAQVFTMNSPVSGCLILIGLGVSNLHFPGLALLGALFEIFGAMIFGHRRLGDEETRLGLFGYDGVLVALAAMIFITPDHIGYTYLVAIVGSFFAGILRCSLGAILKKLDADVLPLTLTFCLTALAIIQVASRFQTTSITTTKTSTSSSPSSPIAAHPRSATNSSSGVGHSSSSSATTGGSSGALPEVDFLFVLEAICRGVGQIIFADHTVGGVFVTIGIAVCSRRAAVGAVMGSSVGTALALLLLPRSLEEIVAIEQGLMGYNSALTATALAGGVFFSSSNMNEEKNSVRNAVLVPCLGALVAFPLQLVWASTLGGATPVMTLPFVTSLWILHPALKLKPAATGTDSSDHLEVLERAVTATLGGGGGRGPTTPQSPLPDPSEFQQQDLQRLQQREQERRRRTSVQSVTADDMMLEDVAFEGDEHIDRTDTKNPLESAARRGANQQSSNNNSAAAPHDVPKLAPALMRMQQRESEKEGEDGDNHHFGNVLSTLNTSVLSTH